ncbi:hypothetical protein MCETWHM1_01034 [Candidatus Methylopumilus planktonicus]|jgi:hypothetical protein|uniref:hypothetical protein n=1 Tax=Candidatus Methylopumilus planktonicus TaxID=1581557 RepID=UPI003BEEC6C4
MIIELITPLILATAPQVTDVSNNNYNHQAQVFTGAKEQIAYSSTRTYDVRGNPWDSDFD